MNKILLVEDDRAIVRSLGEYLNEEGFALSTVDTEEKAIEILENEVFDLALLDISLAEGDGYAVCKFAKTQGVPVIFLTALGDEPSTVKGLDLGADDYVAKPFRPRELMSRIRSVLRRYAKEEFFVLGSLMIDSDKGVVTKDGEEVVLTSLEYRLLMIFVSNRGRLLSRSKLLEEIWDVSGDFVNDNTLTVYIKRLREKIEDNPAKPELIKTVRGLGYRLD